MMKKLLLVLMVLFTLTVMWAVQKDYDVVRSGLTRTAAVERENRISYLSENFENAFPAEGWVLSPASGSGAWLQNDGSSYGPGSVLEGDYAAMFDNWNYSSGTEGSLITPTLDLTAATNPVLKFNWWNNDSDSDPAQLMIYTSTDGSSYTLLDQIDVFGSGETCWVGYSKFISTDVSNVKITGVSDYGVKNTFIDQVSIEDGPTEPEAYVNMSAAYYYEVQVGSSFDPYGDSFTITNNGVGSLTVDSITDLADADFNTNFDTSIALANGESHSFGFTYSPSAAEHDSLNFEIVTNGGTVTIALTGDGFILDEGMVQIGSGYEVTQSIPCEPAWQYTYSQSLYKQDEINISDKQIETIWYQFNGNSAFTDDVDIYMGHSELESVSDWVPVEDLTLVYSGSVTTTASAANWVEIELDIPFLYNNEENLVIAYDENTVASHSYDDDFYCTLTPQTMSVVEYNNDNNVDPASPEASYLVSSRPNIRMQFEEITVQETGIISGTVSDAGSSEAVEGATVSAGVFSTVTDGEGNYTLEVAVGTHTVIIEATDYASFSTENVEVTANNTTTLNAELIPCFTLLDEGFESGTCPPAGWTHSQLEGTEGWSVWEFEHTGSYAARHYPDSACDDWLVTPQLSINGTSELTYWSWMADEGCSVWISTGSNDPIDNEFVLIESYTYEGMGWNYIQIELSEYAGNNIYIAFRGESDGEIHDWTIDDILVKDVVVPGAISGTISLSGGSGDVTEAVVTVGNSSTNPMVDGTYTLITTPGTYQVEISLLGYNTEIISEVVVTSNETTENVNASLTPAVFNPVQNLTIDDGTGTLNWDTPELPGNQEELLYDDGSPATAVNDYGTYFGNRLSPEGPCRVLSIKYFTYCEVDTLSFEAIVLGWNGSTPTEEVLIQNSAIPAEMGDWSEFDLSEYNFTVDGDFVACLQAWMPIALFADEDGGNNRAWRGFTQEWALQGLTYFIRATVEYEDGRIAEISNDRDREVINYNLFLDDMVTPVATISWEEWELEGLNNGQSYTAGVQAVYEGGTSEIVTVDFTYTGTAADDNEVPVSISLKGNYPNPFNPETTISFETIDAEQKTVIQIFNLKGQKVKTLINETLPTGSHSVIWKGNDDNNSKVASGIYLYKMKSGNYSSTRKMILLK